MKEDKADPHISIEISDDENLSPPDFSASEITHLVGCVCEEFAITNAQVSIAIVSDEKILQINNEFLRHDYITDVISFDLSDEDEKCFELIVNAQLAAEKAEEHGHSPKSELALYIVHGMLHMAGFDDATAQQARLMHKKEDEILENLGYGKAYKS